MKCLASSFAVLILSVATLSAAGSEVADAAMKRNMSEVRSLVERKIDVNALQADGTTALHWAVRWDDLETATLLIKAGSSARAANRAGATPLSLACINGSAAMIEKLLRAGADANETLANGETALMMAARTGNPDAIKVLLDNGANMEAAEKLRGTTALMWAVDQNHPAAVQLLTARGANVKARSEVFTPRRGRQADVDAPPPTSGLTGGLTPLVLAARQDAKEVAQILLAAGADVNQTGADGSSPLLVAALNGHYDLARFLLDRGADPNLLNDKGWNPLYIAVKNRNIETGTIPVRNSDNLSPLDFIGILLERGADPNARLKANTVLNNSFQATWLAEAGATPFLRAAFSGDLTVMRLLLSAGADPSIPTRNRTTPLMVAAGIGYAEGLTHDYSENETITAMRMLLDLGANVNAVNDEGMTALHGAAHRGSNAAVQLLVDSGGDLNAHDKGGATFGASVAGGLIPLDWAVGVPIGPQSAIQHADTVEFITRLMNERGIALPSRTRTVGGNAKPAAAK